MSKTKSPPKQKPSSEKSTKAAPELSPIECKEHLDEVLEMQKEVGTLERRMDSSHKVYKEDKDRFELKRDELMQYLKGLNEEHPLFDDHNTVDIPWPFPVPPDCQAATLADVAADPVVLGLSVAVVKAVRDKIKASTLGQLQQEIKADKSLTPAEQTKGKLALGAQIGQNQASKLLRAIASFTGNRFKGPVKESKEKGTKEAKSKPAVENWRDKKVCDLDDITPMQSSLLTQLDMGTVGKALDRFKLLLKDMPVGGPPDFLKKQLSNFMAVTLQVADKIIAAIYDFEEEQTSKEATA